MIRRGPGRPRKISVTIEVEPTPKDEYYTKYPDVGCELAPKCLECPMPRCKHDVEKGHGFVLYHPERDAEIMALKSGGKKVTEIAKLMHIGRDMVYKILRKSENAQGG